MKIVRHPLFAMFLLGITVFGSMKALREVDNYYADLAFEANPEIYQEIPEMLSENLRAYIDASVEDGSYCRQLEKDRYASFGVAHNLCINELAASGSLTEFKERLRIAISVLSPVEMGLLFRWVHLDTLNNKVLHDEIACLDSLKRQANTATDFPLANRLPGIKAYRVSVDPGIQYGEECNILKT